MKYYYSHNGKTAKVMISGHTAIIMFDFRTMFFNDIETADIYLHSIGFYGGRK